MSSDLPSQSAALCEVIETARRLIAAHEQAAALSVLAPPPPLSPAEGIERDHFAFRVERAAGELREALRRIDAAVPAPGMPL